MNLLDLKGPSQRGQGFYWASVIVFIVVHGGFLAYVLAYARLPPQPQPRPAGVDVEVIGTTPFAALRRGDREDVSREARPEDIPPETRLEDTPTVTQPEEDAVKRDAAHSGARALANPIDAPLPEDGARAVKSLPLPDRLPTRRLGISPAVASRAPAIATPRERTSMSLPARRLSRLPSEARLSGRSVADPHPDDGLTAPDTPPLPPLKLLAQSEKADTAPASEEGRAPALDMGPQGSPVAAVLPKEAGIAMFAARIIDGSQMLPEDRSPAPAQMLPERGLDARPVPLPSRRAARLAAARSAEAERADPESAGDEGARGVAGGRKARAYRVDVRAHLAANRPAGAYGSGRAVVVFDLSPAGGVRSARIARSSGNASLDESVLQSISRAAPFPKPPKGLKPAQLRFLIPFEFR